MIRNRSLRAIRRFRILSPDAGLEPMGLVGDSASPSSSGNKSAQTACAAESIAELRRDSHQPGAEIAFRGVLRSREADAAS